MIGALGAQRINPQQMIQQMMQQRGQAQGPEQAGNQIQKDPTQNPQFQAMKQQRYNEVMAHEMAHKSAAPAFTGSIQIDYDSNGVAVGGHVPVSMPALDPANPSASLKAAQSVYAAATAPGGDMSGADAGVAASAQAMIGKAQVLMQQKK